MQQHDSDSVTTRGPQRCRAEAKVASAEGAEKESRQRHGVQCRVKQTTGKLAEKRGRGGYEGGISAEALQVTSPRSQARVLRAGGRVWPTRADPTGCQVDARCQVEVLNAREAADACEQVGVTDDGRAPRLEIQIASARVGHLGRGGVLQ